MTDALQQWGETAAKLSGQLAWATERICALLLALLVLDVWLGVFVRYIVPLPLTFTEEAARYLMIWTALLAVSCGIARREHIGVQFVLEKTPLKLKRVLLLFIDTAAFAFFACLVFYGIGFVASGARSFTMIYGMSKAVPFAAVPVSASLACLQLVLVALRDQAALQLAEDQESAV